MAAPAETSDMCVLLAYGVANIYILYIIVCLSYTYTC